MGKIWFLLYNVIAVPLQYLYYQVTRHFNKKISEGILKRKGQTERIKRALEPEARTRIRILFHCVSVGEWEQALPLISRLKKGNPDIYIIVAFFSPSGYNYAREHPDVDLKVYLPFDSYFRAHTFLKLIQPDLWIIVKHDIWPNHLFAAHRLNIPAILIDASLPSNSRRLSPVVKHFNRHAYKAFHYMFPISEGDRDRFLQIYPYPERLMITGDTRFDQVFTRGQKALKKSATRLFNENNEPVFIAGSIWPSDEKHLLPAVERLMKRYSLLNVVLVPHEPDERHIEDIESALKTASIYPKRYSKIVEDGVNEARVVIIDSVGLLARLYAQTDIAYVGGSFGPGVHNVMEPGILGKPVLFGPKYLNSFEAAELIKCGGGFAVNSGQEIAEKIGEFIEHENKRIEAGNKAMQLIRQNLGATDKICEKLKEIYDFIPGKDSNRDNHIMQR
ncbi:hypothetical protein AMJ80_05840 [bacterium SM23_31]|nr:MAG: hypothetical protein AMJ80_05840 [bacterium SM23_31]